MAQEEDSGHHHRQVAWEDEGDGTTARQLSQQLSENLVEGARKAEGQACSHNARHLMEAESAPPTRL